MATAFIAYGNLTREGIAFSGSLVLNDGEPDKLGPHLARIIARDGADEAFATITGHHTWRAIDSDPYMDGGRYFTALAGYGYIYMADYAEFTEYMNGMLDSTGITFDKDTEAPEFGYILVDTELYVVDTDSGSGIAFDTDSEDFAAMDADEWDDVRYQL